VRLYEPLFTQADPMDVPEGQDWKALLNPGSLEVLTAARVEPSLLDTGPGDRFQFERTGYFAVDADSRPGKPVFNRTVGLKDSWSKIEAKG
jgi:glutaminyl-tRNA synthetase